MAYRFHKNKTSDVPNTGIPVDSHNHLQIDGADLAYRLRKSSGHSDNSRTPIDNYCIDLGASSKEISQREQIKVFSNEETTIYEQVLISPAALELRK